MKKVFEYTAVVLLSAAILSVPLAYAGTIKNWINSDTLYASDLNSNFNHIHNTMVGGHGARLVDADVNASAAISHSKMATPALLPKAWAYINASCTVNGACTILASSRVDSVTRTGAGRYTVVLAYTAADTSYFVSVNSINSAGDPGCGSTISSTSQFAVSCDAYDGTPTDVQFGFMVLDNDN